MALVSSGKRAGSRRASPAPRKLNVAALVTSAGITLCVIAWGYLVYAAIDFGTSARAGDGAPAWGLLALASLGAIACLFAGLMLVSRLMRDLGIGSSSEPPSTADDSSSPEFSSDPSDSPSERPPRAPGGRRAAR